MLSKSLVTFVFAVTICLAIYQNRLYKIAFWKIVTIVFCGAIAAYEGIKLLVFVEYGRFGNWSFFGCIFLVPIVYLFLARIIKEPYEVLMDFAGPLCALLFVIMKIHCFRLGCCYGKCLFTTKLGKEILFPSQIIESVLSGIILVLLLWLQKKEENRGKLAPVFLFLYGSMRFVLSFFRGNPRHFSWLEDTIHLSVPTGQVWSAICIIWGLIWFYRIFTRKSEHKISIKEYLGLIQSMFKSDEQVSDDRD